uniref:Uncharacterized protein n=2 Tax=Timema TaxID=61471 RepID=A0A7R9B798_TIMSH|nr:unnamed protein product [Timema shepardi]CAD7578847.1 unnamed protein product [Timema californicum]
MDSPNTDSCLSLAAHDVVEDVDDQDGMMEVEIQGETATWEDSSKSSVAMELDINSTDDKIETSEEPSGVGHLSMETEESHALPGVNCAAFVEMERGRKGPDESNIDSNNSGGEDRQTILTSTKFDGEESNVESITSTVGDSYTVSKAKLCLADNTLDKSESILRDLNALEIDESSSSNSTKSPSKLKKVEGSTMIKCEMEKEIEKKKVSETKRNNDFEIKKDKVPDITKDKDHQHSHVSKKEKEAERKKDKDIDSKKDSKNEKEKYTEKKKKDVDKNNEHDKKEVNKKFDNDSRKEKESKDKSKSKHDDKHKGEDKHRNKDKSKSSKDIKHEKLDKKDDKLVRSSDKQCSKDDEHTKYNVKEEKSVKSNNKEVSFTKLYSKDAKHDKSENSKNEKHSKSNEKGNDKGEKYVKSREKDSNREKHKDTKHKERSAKSIHCSSTKKDVKGKSSGDDHHQHREKHTSSEDRPSTDRDSNGTASQSQGRESSTTSTVGATSDSSHREDSSKEGKGGKESEGQQSDEAEATHLNIQFKTMVLKLEDCASMLKTGSSQIMLSLPPSPSSSLPFKKRPMQDSDELEDTFEAKGVFKTDIVNGVHEKKITKLEEPIKKNNSDSHGIQKNIKVECVDEIKTEPDLETGKTFQAKRKGSSGDKQNETEKECNPLPRNVKRTKLGEIDQLLHEDMTMSIDTPLVTNQLIIRKKEVKFQQIPSLVDSKQLHLKANPNLQVACQLASKTKFSSIKKPDCSTNDTPESKIKSSCPRSDSKGSTYDKTQSDKEDLKQHINLQSFEDYTEDFKYFVPFENNSFITEKNQHFLDCFARLKAAVEEPITLQLTKFLNTSIESEKKLCSKVTETSKRLEVSKVFPATPQRGRRAGLSSSKATNQSNLGSLRLKRSSSKPASGPNKTLKSPNPSGRRLTKAQEAMELQEEFCQSSTPIYQAPAKPNEPSVSLCGHESTSNSLAVHSNGSSDEDQGYEKADVNALLIDLYKESFTPQDIKGNNNSLIGGCRRVGLSRRLTSQGDGPEQTRKKEKEEAFKSLDTDVGSSVVSAKQVPQEWGMLTFETCHDGEES